MRTVRDVIAHNVAILRKARGMSVRDLSAVMEQVGQKILPSGITAIEQGKRGVGAEDLLALAVALNVNPARLLLPVGDRQEEVALTPAVTVPAGVAWPWVRGETPIAAVAVASGNPDTTLREMIDDFRRHSEPAFERDRLHDDHTAVRATRDVLDRVRALLDEREQLKRDVYSDADREELRDRSAPSLRRALRRLVAEVDDLIGDDDGER